MSRVTDVILTTSLMEEVDETDVFPAVDQVNAWLREHHHSTLLSVDAHAGGTKLMQAKVWLSAVNYLDEPGLIEAVKAAAWVDPEHVRLLLNREESDGFDLVIDGLP